MPQPRVYKDRAEQMRAYRLRKKEQAAHKQAVLEQEGEQEVDPAEYGGLAGCLRRRQEGQALRPCLVPEEPLRTLGLGDGPQGVGSVARRSSPMMRAAE